MTTTAEKLSSLGVTSQQALEFISNNISNPKVIFDICLNYGVNSQMLAEIVSPRFPGVSKGAVEDFFSSNGLRGDLLGTITVNASLLPNNSVPSSPEYAWYADGADGAYTVILDFSVLHPTKYSAINAGLTGIIFTNWGSDDTVVLNNVPVSAGDVYSRFTNDIIREKGQVVDNLSVSALKGDSYIRYSSTFPDNPVLPPAGADSNDTIQVQLRFVDALADGGSIGRLGAEDGYEVFSETVDYAVPGNVIINFVGVDYAAHLNSTFTRDEYYNVF